MRILVTNNGKIEIKNLIDKKNNLNEIEENNQNNNNNNNKIKNKKTISKSLSSKNLNKNKSTIKFNQKNLYENVMKEMFKQYLPEKLHSLNNYLNNNDIYENDNSLINLKKKINKKRNQKKKEEIVHKKSISLGKIIKNNAYNNIINEFKKQNYVYQKNFVQNINSFRTNEKLSEINSLNNSLNKKIDVTKFEFIKYLKNKNNLGYNFLKKISNMKDIEIDKLNRVAQSKKFNIWEKPISKYLFDRKKFHNFLKKHNQNVIKDINENIMNKTQNIFNKFNKKEMIKNEFLNHFYKEKTGLISHLPNLSNNNKKIHNKSSINFYKKIEYD